MARGIQKPFGTMATPASFEAGSEFIDREPSWPPTRQSVDLVAPGEMLRSLDTIPLGEPPIDVDVRSTYAVRPINAYDFNITQVTAMAAGGELGGSFAVITFLVPLGYVAVVRRFHHSFDSIPLPPVVTRSQVVMTLRQQNADVPQNTAIPVGLESDDIVECFYVVEEQATFGARIASSLLITGNAIIHAYGNLIRKEGRPAAQSIGNPVHGALRK